MDFSGFWTKQASPPVKFFFFFGSTQYALEVEVPMQKSLPKPSSATGGEFPVKKERLPQNSVDGEGKSQVSGSGSFVFCEKSTGVAKFRAESNDDPNSTIERIAGQLAMQCLVRGHEPEDFVVLVPAEGPIVGRFLSRAKELLEEGRAVSRPATLSPRQSEILLSVIRNRANKEIASKLNITVRTVKFHISSLLNKFGVDNRVELARRAAGFLKDGAEDADGLAFRPVIESSEPRQLGPVPVKSPSRGASEKARNIRFAGGQVMA
jgi:DNA-binding CsgD family transcriptional regulator